MFVCQYRTNATCPVGKLVLQNYTFLMLGSLKRASLMSDPRLPYYVVARHAVDWIASDSSFP